MARALAAIFNVVQLHGHGVSLARYWDWLGSRTDPQITLWALLLLARVTAQPNFQQSLSSHYPNTVTLFRPLRYGALDRIERSTRWVVQVSNET